MRIQLSDHFTYGRLLRFVLPSIFMMIFTSIYGMVDGFFVANYAGKTAFAAVNLIMPYAMGISVFGFMLGTGGSALISRTLGNGRSDLAQKYFSMFVYAGAVLGTVTAILSIVFMPDIAGLLGAEGQLYDFTVLYGRIIVISTPGFMLQIMFQSYFVAAEKPGLSFRITALAGIMNMVLDWLLVGKLGMSLQGAAIATVTAEFTGGLVPVAYFIMPNNSLLRLRKCSFYAGAFFKACFNGISEMVSNFSSTVVNIVYNFQLLRIIGEDGVSAYGIIMYVMFIFVAVMVGFSIGSAPITGYNLGAGNKSELKNIYRKSMVIMAAAGLLMVSAAEIFARPVVGLYAGSSQTLLDLATGGFRIYAVAFLFMGINIWSSSFFTALSNGKISAVISFTRTFVIQLLMVLILPYFFGVSGIWSSIVVAETASLFISLFFLTRYGKFYGYR